MVMAIFCASSSMELVLLHPSYHSFILEEIPLNSCIFVKAGMIPVILLL